MLIRENEEKKRLIMMIVTRQVPRTDIYYQTGKIFPNPNSDIILVRDIDFVVCLLNQDSPESWSFFRMNLSWLSWLWRNYPQWVLYSCKSNLVPRVFSIRAKSRGPGLIKMKIWTSGSDKWRSLKEVKNYELIFFQPLIRTEESWCLTLGVYCGVS